MKFKFDKISIAFILFLFIFAAAVYYKPSFEGLGKGEIGAGGFTINSITSTQVISNDADLQTANFIVSATANGGGQYIVDTFDQADFKKYGFSITYPMKIEIGSITETFKFPIKNDGEPLYKFRPQKIPRASWYSGAKCPDKASDGYWSCYEIPFTSDTKFGNIGNDAVIKVYRDNVGSIGSFDNPFITWDGDITMTVQGTPITKKFSSSIQQSVEFYSGNEWKGTAKWTGSLITGNPTPNQNLYKAIYLKSNNVWRVAQMKYYNDYKSAIFQPLPTSKFNDMSGNSFTENDISTAVSSYNNIVDILSSQNDKISYTSATGTTFEQTTQGDEQDGNIVSKGIFSVGYPNFQFILKAKSLGVLIPVGKPQIISINAPESSSGDNKASVSVTFKNIGDASGSFSASMTVNSPFYQQGTPDSVSVSPGGTGTIFLQIGHSTKGDVSGTIKVYDTNKPSSYDTKTFTTKITDIKSCIPGSFDPRGNIIYKCKADGSDYELFLQCNGGDTPIFIDNTYKCKSPIPIPTSTISVTTIPPTSGGKVSVSKWFENPWLAIGLMIAMLSGIYYLSGKRKR